MQVSLADIEKAQKLLSSIITPTELSHSISASKLIQSDIYFKFENTQRTGSFKFRGAYNKISSLNADEKSRGVIASSAGNHAQGVALSATLAGVKSTIVMPETAPLSKVAATRAYGADIIQHGEIYDDAYECARKLEKEKGYTFVHPFEDPYIIAGQGTIGLEILHKLPDVESIVVPIGGGGLISGVALAAKTLNPKVRIIGVQSDRSPGMECMFNKKNNSVDSKRAPTIADGIAVKKPSQVIHDYFISKYVDEIVTVSDDEIAEAIVFLMERTKAVAEGSGAASMAAVMHRGLKLGKKSCVVISGGNIDLNIVSKIIDRGQVLRGRLCELAVMVDDLPGNLNKLTQVIASMKANILEVRHDRVSKGLSLRQTRIEFDLETTGTEHIEKIKKAIQESGVGSVLQA